jgi:hypothetical protein
MGVINPAQFKFGSRLHKVLDLDLDTNLGQGYTQF